MKNPSTPKPVVLLVTALLFSSLFSCNEFEKETIPYGLPEKSLELVNANVQFGFNFYNELNKTIPADSNLMFSPLSVSLALSMACNGAGGETLSEMTDVLGFSSLTLDEINTNQLALIETLSAIDSSVLIDIADACYFDKNVKPKSLFTETNQHYYKAEISALDFSLASSLKVINDWVSEKTHQKIPAIINSLDPQMVMVLLNAIYFNGIWSNKFMGSLTQNKPFYCSNGTVPEVPFMNKESTYEYCTNELFSAVHLPYGKGQFRMTLFLPNEDKRLEDLTSKLTVKNWNEWLSDFKMTEHVFLLIPRFTFSWGSSVSRELKSLGMEKAFQSQLAEFDNIAEGADFCIDQVVHKTFIDVNEDGTEAAAVTAITWTTSSGPDEIERTVFNANRPFLFTISEKSTGAILFMGRVKNFE